MYASARGGIMSPGLFIGPTEHLTDQPAINSRTSVSFRMHERKGLKFCKIMYLDQFQKWKWLDMDHALLIP